MEKLSDQTFWKREQELHVVLNVCAEMLTLYKASDFHGVSQANATGSTVLPDRLEDLCHFAGFARHICHDIGEHLSKAVLSGFVIVLLIRVLSCHIIPHIKSQLILFYVCIYIYISQ